jgi:hypothetical protein
MLMVRPAQCVWIGSISGPGLSCYVDYRKRAADPSAAHSSNANTSAGQLKNK